MSISTAIYITQMIILKRTKLNTILSKSYFIQFLLASPECIN